MLTLILFASCLAARATASDGRWLIFVNEDRSKMLSVLTDPEEGVYRDCYASGDYNVIEGVISNLPNAKVTEVDQPTVDHLISLCIHGKTNEQIMSEEGHEVFNELGIFSPLLIFPGTKWCGAGNISTDYNDLGPEIECDKCCRTHDHCEDSIPARQTKHGLKNRALYTKSHCDCDNEFYRCLLEADTKTSNRVGKIFFNYLQMNCFKQEHPVKKCKRHIGTIRTRCTEYELDETKDPIWQWFDAKEYETGIKGNQTAPSGTGDVFQFMLETLESTNTCAIDEQIYNKNQL